MDQPHAGAMRQRIAFEQRQPASDGYGNTEGAWAEQFSVRAQIIPRVGGEQVLASRLAGVQPYTIFLRYSQATAAVDTTWRARNVRTGEIYNIRSTGNPDQKHQFIELLADSGKAV